MSLRKVLWFVLPAVILGALGWWIHRRSSGPPEAPFARVQRERLVSTLVTNGRAEPWEWVAVRAERPGLIERVAVEKGARVFPAQAELEGLKQGGRTVGSPAEAIQSRRRAPAAGRAGFLAPDHSGSLERHPTGGPGWPGGGRRRGAGA
jgi:multidrug efflux pump subunit AcrA (membrane-fusion protein)